VGRSAAPSSTRSAAACLIALLSGSARECPSLDEKTFDWIAAWTSGRFFLLGWEKSVANILGRSVMALTVLLVFVNLSLCVFGVQECYKRCHRSRMKIC